MDALFAYYFYRLLQRAKNIKLLYTDVTKGMSSGEMSRFLYQIKYESGLPIRGLMFSNVIIRDGELRRRWLERHYNFDNPLSVAAAQAAYERGEPWLEELRAYLDENFALTAATLAERLPRAVFHVSEATYLAWVDLSAYFEPRRHPHRHLHLLHNHRLHKQRR